jgi:hypothetical protein
MLATMGAKRRAARPSRELVSSQGSRELRGFRSREPLMSRWPGSPPKIASNQLFPKLFALPGWAECRQIGLSAGSAVSGLRGTARGLIHGRRSTNHAFGNSDF